jgi:UDP-N-acetyl-D-mannosaminuronic acid dehydrogenase
MSEIRSIVVVGGCGHVGLPFGMVLADHGLQVVLLDVDEARVASLNQGKMPFKEDGAESLLPRLIGKNLRATTDPSACGAQMWLSPSLARLLMST